MWKRGTGFVLLLMLVAMIWDGALYGAWNPLQDPTLIGWWTCDEGTGGVVADSSVNGNDGTFVYGSPAWTAGVYGNAVRLVGPTLVQVPPLGITLTEATMAGWFLPNGVQPDWAAMIMHRNPGPAHGFNVLADGRLAYHWNDTYASWSFRGSAFYAPDEWTFCALTVQPTRATFYVNGSAAAVNTIAHAPATWDGPFWLGGDGNNSWASRRMNGALDDVSFFSRALTETEIQAMMLGLGGQAPPAGTNLATEDFETNDFSRHPWVPGGDSPWYLSSHQSHGGLYSAVSGSIADDETSVLSVVRACVSGEITFYCKVSSEPICDLLIFSIDGVERGRWSGEQDWAEVSFPVAAGTHTFAWAYAKDSSGSRGSDTAWIDDITFPPGARAFPQPPVPLVLPPPVAHWKLDETYGNVAVDSIGRHNGWVGGDPTWLPTGGRIGGALQFDGIDDYVDTHFSQDLTIWTMSAWVTSPAVPAARDPTGPVHRERNYQMNWDHTNAQFRGTAALAVGGTWYPASFGPLAANVWYHLAATYDGHILRAYKNGALVGMNTAPSGPPDIEPATLKLGCHAWALQQCFAGTVDDVRVYDSALRADEVRSLFEAAP
jgi:hypothetical protein